jgi:ribosomal protein L7/L12
LLPPPLNLSALLADDRLVSTQALIALVIGVVLALVLLRRHGEVATVPAAGSSAQATTVESALAAGRKIEAIKLYRQEHGVGLREAKEAIEELQRRAPAQ